MAVIVVVGIFFVVILLGHDDDGVSACTSDILHTVCVRTYIDGTFCCLLGKTCVYVNVNVDFFGRFLPNAQDEMKWNCLHANN